MEASLSVQRRAGASKILSRDGGSCAAARGRSASRARPAAWYRRALGGGLHLWRKPAAVEATPATAAEAARRGRPPLWRSSLKAVGSALARVARACKPVFSGGGGGGHTDALAPARRKGRATRSGGSSPPVAAPAVSMPAGEWDKWRCVFMGTSPLNDDDEVLVVRRLVLEEEYATRRRVEMQAAAKRSRRFWFPPGPSRLSQMSMADDDSDVSEDDDSA